MVIAGSSLGLNADSVYAEKEFPFEPGDKIFFYSDGLIECVNEQDELYGESRLRRLLKGVTPGITASVLNKEIIRDLISFRVGAQLKDDVTTVAMRRIS
jgi:phosphoserine phosphatase RsbU/P